MNNIQRLAATGEKNHKVFASTIVDLMSSQGFYGRLYHAINGLSEDAFKTLYDQLSQQHFNDSVDVVLWLES